MKRGSRLGLLFSLCSVITGIQAQTIDYSTVFPTVVQGHTNDLVAGCDYGNKSTLKVTNNSKITGGSSPSLNVCSVDPVLNNNCVNGGVTSQCFSNGKQIETMVLDAFSSSTSTNPELFKNNKNGQLGETGITEFGDVTIENRRQRTSITVIDSIFV